MVKVNKNADNVKLSASRKLNDSQRSDKPRPKKPFKEYLKEKQDINQNPHTAPTPMQLFGGNPGAQIELAAITETLQSTIDFYETLCDSIVYMKNEGKQELSIQFNGTGVLDGTEINIEFYDTAPGSFHIQFGASPEALQLLAKQAQTLTHHLEAQFQNYQFVINNPELNEEFRYQAQEIRKKNDRLKQKRELSSKIKAK
jgi:hypothetical protein